jgi:hypothetical protein
VLIGRTDCQYGEYCSKHKINGSCKHHLVQVVIRLLIYCVLTVIILVESPCVAMAPYKIIFMHVACVNIKCTKILSRCSHKMRHSSSSPLHCHYLDVNLRMVGDLNKTSNEGKPNLTNPLGFIHTQTKLNHVLTPPELN